MLNNPFSLTRTSSYLEQNNEVVKRKSIKSKVIGTAKVLSYDDLIVAEQERDIREAEGRVSRGRRKSKHNQLVV